MPKTYYVAINVEDENQYETTSDLALAIEVALGERCIVEASSMKTHSTSSTLHSRKSLYLCNKDAFDQHGCPKVCRFIFLTRKKKARKRAYDGCPG
jgi:hypothetical protein